MVLKILFVEPPKDYWFLMGEYLPPPTALLALAAYVERELDGLEIEILDCQAERKDWKGVEKHIMSSAPDIVASSGFTCNAYGCARVAQTAKTVDPRIVTVVGGQHFSFTDKESLDSFPEIDFIVRGEGERTLVDLIRSVRDGRDPSGVRGISFRKNGKVIRNQPRELIENLDDLPFPAYHLVEKNLGKYNFRLMAGADRYLIMEGSRGCWHNCSFCTQWKHWSGLWRTKSPKRLGEEMAHLRDDLGAEFIWLTDDNFGYLRRGKELAEELEKQGFNDSAQWFFQARTDEIVQNPEIVARLRSVGNNWQLLGVESGSPETLRSFRKEERVEDSMSAIRILKQNNIFSQAMLVIGSRKDTAESIRQLREYTATLEPDLALFTVLTPYPGTEIFEEAEMNGWIEDRNYGHYDMSHAIMPTETLSRREVQEELLECYRSFFGSPMTILKGIFSRNEIKKRSFRHLAGKRVLGTLRQLV